VKEVWHRHREVHSLLLFLLALPFEFVVYCGGGNCFSIASAPDLRLSFGCGAWLRCYDPAGWPTGFIATYALFIVQFLGFGGSSLFYISRGAYTSAGGRQTDLGPSEAYKGCPLRPTPPWCSGSRLGGVGRKFRAGKGWPVCSALQGSVFAIL